MKSLFAFLVIFVSSAFGATPAETSIHQAQDAIARQPDYLLNYNNLAMAYVKRAAETEDCSYYGQAEGALQKSFAMSPDNYDGLKARTAILLGRREFAKALELASKLNKQTPDDISVYGYLADANTELGNYKEAVDAVQWMLNIRPGNVGGLTRAGTLRELHGDLTGAVELMQAAYDSTPLEETADRASILSRLSHIYLLSGDTQNAEASAGSALEVFPGYGLALDALAQVRIARKQYSEAATLLRKRYAAAPQARTLYALAEALALAGSKVEADTAFAEFEKQALRESAAPNNANHELVVFYTGYAKKPAEALRIAAREAARRHDAFTLDCYAWSLAANGDYTRADAAMKSALAFGVKDPRILSHADAISNRRH